MKTTIIIIKKIITGLMLLTMACVAHAELRTFSYKGVVDVTSGGPLAVFAGQTLEVTFTFEATTPDANGDPATGSYSGAITNMTVKVGGKIYQQQVAGINSITIFNDNGNDLFQVNVGLAGPDVGGVVVINLILFLQDSSPSALVASDALPSSEPDPVGIDSAGLILTFSPGNISASAVEIVSQVPIQIPVGGQAQKRPPAAPAYYDKGPDSPFTATIDLSSAEKTGMVLMEAALQVAESVIHATSCTTSAGQADITVWADGIKGSQFNTVTVTSSGGVYILLANPNGPVLGRGQKISVDLIGGVGQFMGTWMTQYSGKFRFNQSMSMMTGRNADITVFGHSGHDDHYKIDVIKDFNRGAKLAKDSSGAVNSEYYVIYDWGLQALHKEKYPVNKYWQRSKTTRSNSALGHTVFVKDRLVGATPCRIVINTYGDNNASIFNQSGKLTISTEIPDAAVTGLSPLGTIVDLF